ncbi:MAG: AraC family transcriptional regulator, partial [Bacteroidota bacterium]
DSILSNEWKISNIKIQHVINEIINCSYKNELRDLFLWSKSIELLVLQAELYEYQASNNYIRSKADKQKLIEAKELITTKIDNPPTIIELSELVGINEYKLKKGFKELFGTTIFGYTHSLRMSLAKKLLLGTEKTAQEIAYEAGYSSPQHFSKAFKNTFGVSPNSIRKNPDWTI